MAMGKDNVYGIGLSRTGTTSLTSALKKLGYTSKHYPSYFLDKFFKYTSTKEISITMIH